jgi:hypothetical protein
MNAGVEWLFSIAESLVEMASQLSLGGGVAWLYNPFPCCWSVFSISFHAGGGGVAWYSASFFVHSIGYALS